jgi:predicted AAA+ superfamily ATPase
LDDLKKKIVLLTGPRQSGKITLSQMLSNNFDYLNFDNPEHRPGIIERIWDRSKDLIIFDELHRLNNWKSWPRGPGFLGHNKDGTEIRAAHSWLANLTLS